MVSLNEQIKLIEEEIKKTPYHKATEHHIGRLRARLAQLKDKSLTERTQKSGGGPGFAIRKSGDATVVLLGPPSVGKSSLVNVLSNAQSKVAEYDFTTLDVVPGMMDYHGAQIQFFDLPGIIQGAAQGKGRGREVLSVLRTADLILVMVDVKTINKIDQVKKEVAEFGLRLGEKSPQVAIHKKTKGGLKVTMTTPLTRLSLPTIKEVAKQFKLVNAEIVIKEDLPLQRLIDAFSGNRLFLPYLLVVNKTDLGAGRLPVVAGEEPIFISVQKKEGLEELKRAVWRALGLIRVYLKPQGKEPDFASPLIIKKGTTVRQLLDGLSLCTKDEIKRVKISGPGAKFPGQEVSFSFCPRDGTIISFLT